MPDSQQAVDNPEFAGKRVLVTGGTKGIGEAVVARFVRSGANVVTTARTRPNGQLTARLVQADVSTPEGCQRVIKEVIDVLGGLDILVNSVGGSTAPSGGALALSDEDWQHTLDLNLTLGSPAGPRISASNA
jgi:NAD(P)-dependent dehydrogenase (short-subunit alcohol dehydrogenase family)